MTIDNLQSNISPYEFDTAHRATSFNSLIALAMLLIWVT